MLTAAGGTRLGLAANAASFPAVAAAAALMHARREPPGPPRRDAGARRRCALLRRDPVLRVAIGAAVAGLLFISASMTVEVFYVRDVVGAGGAGFALVFAAWTGRHGGRRARSSRRAPPPARSPPAALAALALQGAGMAAAACLAGARPGSWPATSSAASATASRTSCCAR